MALSRSLGILLASLIGYIVSESVVLANIPAAYLACEGAPEGSDCSLPGPQFGVCVRDTLCVDLEQTAVDECVLCVDGCWAGRDGESCVRPWTGEEGICETQDRCTDRLETSFEECRRCVSLSSIDQGVSAEEPVKGLDHDANDHCEQKVRVMRGLGGARLTPSFVWLLICFMLWRVTRLIRRQR